MNVLGIDIGTTTISLTVVNAANGETQKALTIDSDSFIKTEKPYEKIQSVEKIEKKIFSALEEFIPRYKPSAIGVTGQMHGILYTDASGNACSPLYTWQDGRAGQQKTDKGTYCDTIKSVTGYSVPQGYGLATHYFNAENELVPENAEHLCTVHDYIAMLLAGKQKPVIHVSNAASLGFFDSDTADFDKNALQKLGINPNILPTVTDKETVIGEYKGIPVAVAIGDNQASFFGSVADSENTLLVNIGTGSQISLLGNKKTLFPSGEVRPLSGDKHILVGSALCGGRAYACLERFFRSAFEKYCGSCKSAYRFMDALAKNAYPTENPICVDTAFSGKRSDPTARGSINNIDTDNFTPEHLVCGVLKGTVDELYGMYSEISDTLTHKPTKLVGSGNGLRKSPVWCKICEDVFGMKLLLPAHTEEAAYGAAVFALAACGIYKNIEEAQKIIKYLQR